MLWEIDGIEFWNKDKWEKSGDLRQYLSAEWNPAVECGPCYANYIQQAQEMKVKVVILQGIFVRHGSETTYKRETYEHLSAGKDGRKTPND